MGAALVLLLVGLGAMAAGVLIGRYYVPDDRQLRRTARHSRAYMRALSHLLARDHDTVVSELRTVVEENVEDAEPYFALGAVFRSRGEHERAIRVHQALALRERDKRKLRQRAMYELGLDFRAAGMPRRATRAMEEVVVQEPSHEGALRVLGALYEEQARFNEAASLWQRLGRRRGEDTSHREHHLLVAAAQAALGRGDLDSAKQLLKAAQKLHESAHFFAAAAELAAARGNHGGARERLRQALIAEPGLAPHLLPGLIAAEQGLAGETAGENSKHGADDLDDEAEAAQLAAQLAADSRLVLPDSPHPQLAAGPSAAPRATSATTQIGIVAVQAPAATQVPEGGSPAGAPGRDGTDATAPPPQASDAAIPSAGSLEDSASAASPAPGGLRPAPPPSAAVDASVDAATGAAIDAATGAAIDAAIGAAIDASVAAPASIEAGPPAAAHPVEPAAPASSSSSSAGPRAPWAPQAASSDELAAAAPSIEGAALVRWPARPAAHSAGPPSRSPTLAGIALVPPQRIGASIADRVLAVLAEIEVHSGPRLELALIRAQLVPPADLAGRAELARELTARFPEALAARVATARLAIASGDPAAIRAALDALVSDDGALAWALRGRWQCAHCGNRPGPFSWRCGQCRRWGTLRMETGLEPPPVAPRERRAAPRVSRPEALLGASPDESLPAATLDPGLSDAELANAGARRSLLGRVGGWVSSALRRGT